VAHLAVGTPVTLKPNGPGVRGSWRTQLALPASGVMRTPARLSPTQAAAAWLVYLTAWVALTELSSLGAGDWLLVTAANSAVALAACDVARHLGARTIGAVRSQQAADAIRDVGFEAVVRTDEVRLGDAARELADGGVQVALDCVLGEVGNECLRALRPYGTLVVYGALSGQPLELRGGLAIARQPTVRGLWLGQWLQDGPPERVQAAFAALERRFVDGSLTPRIDRTFPLQQVAAAVRFMTAQGRAGKVVLTC
jgi:NADPH:quinone reductase-like Zn-dependent oxidoreductase